MIYVILILIGVATFGLCFVVDKLIGRAKKKRAGGKVLRRVRQPRRAAGIGIVLAVAGIALMMFLKTGLGTWGGIVITLMGAVLIGSYFLFAIDYDDEGFTCRTLKSKDHYLYNQIRGEQAVATRSGISVLLFVGDTTVEMSEAMDGVREFLQHAYYARCRQMGIDPESCPPPAPRELVWFPEPEDQ